MANKPAEATKEKPASTKKTASETEIKYADKSAGQPELVLIFEKLKELLLPFVKEPIVLTGGNNGQVSLVSKKPVEIAGRKKEEMWFAGLLIQKGYVGFYYLPIYTEPEIKDVLSPELLKCLKGKSCFHIKKDNAILYEQVKDALQKGYDRWKQNGWL